MGATFKRSQVPGMSTSPADAYPAVSRKQRQLAASILRSAFAAGQDRLFEDDDEK